MKITIRGNYTISGKIAYRPESPLVELPLPSDGTAEILLSIDLARQSIEATGEYEISEEFLDLLKQEDLPKELPPNIVEEASEIRRHITSSVRQVLYAVKYCLKQIELDENLFGLKNITYSFDNMNWRFFPGAKLTITASSYSTNPLDIKSAELIRDHLSSEIEPFLALSFLHRAKKERHPKYKWIDATIAAEIAIKEFLILIKPEVESVLLEVPSPPLHKLYGSILESYTGQRSPVLKHIAEGARVRNQLVHRPEKVNIDSQEAIDYLKHVEMAIGHLLGIINPEYYQRHWCVDHYSIEE
jgi:hypothetical protein